MSLSPDPLEHALAGDARQEDAAARDRGVRLATIADALVSELVALGFIPARYAGSARVHCFGVLADHLYGSATIDIPARLGRLGDV
jgi:hypothetical protein